jgi:hypothetical protein
MVERLTQTPPPLYLTDETAWLEQTARLVAEGRWDEVDRENLSEYLNDMAIRDRREVMSRLVVLLMHLLKWDHQPEKRTGSWEATIETQRLELRDLLESRTLLNYAQEVLGKAYERAVSPATKETGLSPGTFPPICPYTLADVLGEE